MGSSECNWHTTACQGLSHADSAALAAALNLPPALLPPPRRFAGVVEAGWTHAAGMLYRTYQIAMGGHILDPTEVGCGGASSTVPPFAC